MWQAPEDVVLIVGMHRSGTSAVSGAFHRLGAELGPDMLEAQSGINEAGFWENAAFVEQNERLLDELGSAWYDFRALPERWQETGVAARHIGELSRVVSAQLNGARLAAVKDPRLCRLLPAWRQVLEPSGTGMACVMVSRDPVEVAASLAARDGIDPFVGGLLWTAYTLDAERGSRGLSRGVVLYEQILRDPSGAMAELIDTIGLPRQRAELSGASEPVRVVDPGLHHHRAEELDGWNAGERIPALARDLYATLRAGEGCRMPALDDWYAEWQAELARHEGWADALARTVAGFLRRGQELTRLGEDHREALDTIAERDRQLGERDARLESLGDEHGRALETIAERDRQLGERDARLESLGDEHGRALETIAERDGQLRECNERLETLGSEHEHALSTIAERDRQLEALSQERDRLEMEARDARSRLEAVRRHPVMRVLRGIARVLGRHG